MSSHHNHHRDLAGAHTTTPRARGGGGGGGGSGSSTKKSRGANSAAAREQADNGFAIDIEAQHVPLPGIKQSDELSPAAAGGAGDADSGGRRRSASWTSDGCGSGPSRSGSVESARRRNTKQPLGGNYAPKENRTSDAARTRAGGDQMAEQPHGGAASSESAASTGAHITLSDSELAHVMNWAEKKWTELINALTTVAEDADKHGSLSTAVCDRMQDLWLDAFQAARQRLIAFAKRITDACTTGSVVPAVTNAPDRGHGSALYVSSLRGYRAFLSDLTVHLLRDLSVDKRFAAIGLQDVSASDSVLDAWCPEWRTSKAPADASASASSASASSASASSARVSSSDWSYAGGRDSPKVDKALQTAVLACMQLTVVFDTTGCGLRLVAVKEAGQVGMPDVSPSPSSPHPGRYSTSHSTACAAAGVCERQRFFSPALTHSQNEAAGHHAGHFAEPLVIPVEDKDVNATVGIGASIQPRTAAAPPSVVGEKRSRPLNLGLGLPGPDYIEGYNHTPTLELLRPKYQGNPEARRLHDDILALVAKRRMKEAAKKLEPALMDNGAVPRVRRRDGKHELDVSSLTPMQAAALAALIELLEKAEQEHRGQLPHSFAESSHVTLAEHVRRQLQGFDSFSVQVLLQCSSNEPPTDVAARPLKTLAQRCQYCSGRLEMDRRFH